MELDGQATKDALLATGRTIAGYCRINRLNVDGFRMALCGSTPCREGGKAWRQYVPTLQKDGLAVFREAR